MLLNDPLFSDALNPYIIQGIAPASGIHKDKIKALQDLKQFNIDLTLATMDDSIRYHSHQDEMRFKQLKEAIYNPSQNTIIWSLRGGYGSGRLIDMLHALPKPLHEKRFIGCSDITALHLFFSQVWHWSTIHGSGLTQLLDPEQDPQNFIKIADILRNNLSSISIELLPFNDEAAKRHAIKGYLTGGNLTLVENSIGTLWQIQTNDKILFLEEVGEKAYRIDRSLLHLHQAGLLKNLQAIVFGQFIHPEKEDDVFFALQRFAKEIPIPVYQSKQFGHGAVNHPLVYNKVAEIRPTEIGVEQLSMVQ